MPSAIYYVQQLPEDQFQVTMEVKFIWCLINNNINNNNAKKVMIQGHSKNKKK